MQVNYDQLYLFLEEYGAEPKEKGNIIECKTICHGGHKHKLYFYKDTNRFYCYTQCGSLSIYELLDSIGHIELYNNIVDTKKELNSFDGFNYQEVELPFYPYQEGGKELPLLAEKNEVILDNYYDLYYNGWIKENIDIDIMRQYNIKYDILNDRIIIPNYDIHNRFIGMRCRELDKNAPAKYHPIYQYEFESSKNLFGINHIKNYNPLIIVEAEKSVLQLNSYGYYNCVALLGSNLSEEQVALINHFSEINEVVIALDKEYKDLKSDEFVFYLKKIKKNFYDKLKKFGRTVSIIIDKNNLLDEKDSPTDKGKEVFDILFKEREMIEE